MHGTVSLLPADYAPPPPPPHNRGLDTYTREDEPDDPHLWGMWERKSLDTLLSIRSGNQGLGRAMYCLAKWTQHMIMALNLIGDATRVMKLGVPYGQLLRDVIFDPITTSIQNVPYLHDLNVKLYVKLYFDQPLWRFEKLLHGNLGRQIYVLGAYIGLGLQTELECHHPIQTPTACTTFL